jgi:hypothetical protein
MNDKAQQEFEKHCGEWLNMDAHLQPAQSAYWKAFNSEKTEHKKKNAGQRALNLYLLNELKKINAHVWRKDKKQDSKPINKVNIQNADTSAVAYKGNGTRPKHLTIKTDY